MKDVTAKNVKLPKLSFKKRWVMLPAILLLATQCYTTVPANNVGVRYNAFNGGVQQQTLPSGVHFKIPFVDHIYNISTELNTVMIDRVTTQTKDGQYVDTTLDVKYYVDADNAMIAFQQFKENTIERLNLEVVKPIVQRAVEEVTVDYDVFEVLGSKRNEVYQKIEVNVQKALSSFGLTYKSLVIVDSDAKDEVESAIQQEAIAQQAVAVATQNQERAKIDMATELLEAQNKAEKKRIEAEAEAQANKVLADSLNENLVKYMEAKAREKHGWVEVITDSALVDTTN